MSVATEDKAVSVGLAQVVVSSACAGWSYLCQLVLLRLNLFSTVLLACLLPLLVAGFSAAQTSKGSALFELAIGARTEWRKVVWPTKQERNQTTLIVVAVILLMSLILWGIDSLLSWGAAQIMG